MAVFEVHADRTRLLGTMILSALVVAIGITLITLAATTPKFNDAEAGVRIFAILICSPLLFMIMPFLFSLKRWRRTDPEISINDEEIYAWMWADTPIKWSNIDYIIAHQVGATKMISLKLLDPTLNPPRRKRHKLADLNRDLVNAAARKTQSNVSKAALKAISHSAYGALKMAQNMPDHRNPVLHTANTNVKHVDLITAIENRMPKPRV